MKCAVRCHKLSRAAVTRALEMPIPTNASSAASSSRQIGVVLWRAGMVVLQPLPGMGQAPTHSTGVRTCSALRYARLLDVLAGRTAAKAPALPRNSPERIALDQCLQRLAPPARPAPFKTAAA